MGHLDSELTINGCQQSISMAALLKNALPTPKIIYSSDLARAQKTASIIRDACNIEDKDYHATAALRETDFGDYSGKLKRHIHNHLSRIKEDLFMESPNGESINEMQRRVIECFKNEIMQCAHDSIIVITHSGPIRAILSHCNDISLKQLYAHAIGHDINKLNHSNIQLNSIS